MTTFCNFISEKSTGIQLLFLQSSWKNMNADGRVFHKKVDHRERAVERRVLDNWCIAVMNHVGANVGKGKGTKLPEGGKPPEGGKSPEGPRNNWQN